MPTRRLLLAALGALAVPAGRAAPGGGTGYSFRFEWIEGGQGGLGDARMDLGTLAARGADMRARRISLRRRVAVRIDGPGTAARVTVALGAETPGCELRLNGLVLSTMPRLLDPAHRLGTAVVHQLEIVVPSGVAPGPFLSQMQWQAEPA